MKPLSRRIPDGLRLAILTGLLAMLTAAMALGYAHVLPWTPRWYPPLHALFETCSVVLALLVFSIGAHMGGRRLPATVALLSASALAVGLLGIGHLLSIPVLPGEEAPAAASATGFWVVARASAALALLAAALAPAGRTVGRGAYRLCVLGAAVVAVCGYWLALVRPDLLPPTYVPGRDTGVVKPGFEALLVVVNAAAALVLLLRVRSTPTVAARYLATAAALLGLSGINYTLYHSPGDVSSMATHLVEVLAFLCLYRATLADGRNALPGLPHGRQLLDMLEKAIEAARRKAGSVAVIVLDIDGFRKINSHYGWTGGEDVLHECVARLSARLGAGDTLARQGGNEFIVVRRHAGREDTAALAKTLQECMHLPFTPRGHQVFLSASVGIAMLPAGRCEAPQLLHMAQVANACARADGPAHRCFYTASMEGSIRERIGLESMLCHAAERGQLVLQYQPRIGMKDGNMVGVEALVRWRHPELGLLAPGRFIPIAEESSLINELDLWVLREACTRAAAWRAQGLFRGRVSVNLSARQFREPGLAGRVRSALDDSGLDPAGLELEITESTVMQDTEEAAAVLRSLRALGVTVSIDDFGMGYSSLSYLKLFPLDVLKIDRAFVTDMVGDTTGTAIVRAIITLAHSLGLAAVAEGVETADQVAFLKENGCDQIQGYYFSRPVWPEQLSRMLMKEAALPC